MSSGLSHIKSIENLQEEKFRVRERIREHESQFKRKFEQLPGELAVAGANNLIPRFLRGKVTNTALQGGKFLIDKFFVSDANSGKPTLLGKAKKTGVIPFVKKVFKMFKGRK